MKIWVVNGYEYSDHIGTLAAFLSPEEADKFIETQSIGVRSQNSYNVEQLEVID